MILYKDNISLLVTKKERYGVCESTKKSKYKDTSYMTKRNIYFEIEQKGMTFDHDFSYSFPLFYSLLREEEKEND